MPTTYRYVPQGSASLSSDAPGWSADVVTAEIQTSGDEKRSFRGIAPEESKGPICWKCKGACYRPLRAQDVMSNKQGGAPDSNTSFTKKKKPKRLERKRSLKGEVEKLQGSQTFIAESGGDDVRLETHAPHRICPVCSGNGHLPVRRRYVNSLNLSSTSNIGGHITSRRRRPSGWDEFGHFPPAVQACDEIFAKENVESNQLSIQQYYALATLHEANSSCGHDVPIRTTLVNNPPPWLPINPGEQLCNLVGRWRILQKVGSHRWTTDDLVTAYIAASAYVEYSTCPFKEIQYLDLGTGNGSVLQMVVWYLLSRLSDPNQPSCNLMAVGVEARQEAVELARRSLSFNLGRTEIEGKTYCGSVGSISKSKVVLDPIQSDAKIVLGDFRDLVSLSQSSTNGCSSITESDIRNQDMRDVASKRYNLITGTPPYFRVDFSLSNSTVKPPSESESTDLNLSKGVTAVIQQGGMPTSMQSAPARCEFRGGVEAYCQAASAMLDDHNGIFVVCENWLNNNRVQKGAREAGLNIVRVWPVLGKVGKKDPLFAVYVMKKQIVNEPENRAEIIEPPIVVRDENGKWTRDYAIIMDAMSIPVVF